MSSKVKAKGLLKGFKFLSLAFDGKDDDVIKIGFPTDVKHVAHIGWDGPSANTPSWMSEFKSDQNAEVSSEPEAVKPRETNEVKKERISKSTEIGRIRDIPKSRHISLDGQSSSPTKKRSDEKKHARRHRASDTSSESSTRGSSKPTRRHRHSNQEGELPPQEGAAVPKHTRRRKKNLSVDNDSVRSAASSPADLSDLGCVAEK